MLPNLYDAALAELGEEPPERGLPLSMDSKGEEAWPKPLPILERLRPEAYPIDALPDTVRAAVEEVQTFVKAPMALVASSALGALSLAIQAYADVERATRLSGPSSLFLLTIADSGERKSTCDSFFSEAIREYQELEAEAAKPDLQKYQASSASWEAGRAGILAAIQKYTKEGKDLSKKKEELEKHEAEKPTPPKVPKLLLGDETTEHLAWVLSQQWPSCGMVSSEAGIIFGSHAMGKDSIMRTLSFLNTRWDGAEHSVGRRSSESFIVGKETRLTAALQVQEPTLRNFFDKYGDLARGSGFLARFLISWPESTQGFRLFTEAPTDWPKLAAFNQRISEILQQPLPINEEDIPCPTLLTLTPEAKVAWVAFHNLIETQLRDGGELFDVKDVASKAADNAARLAALFQFFEHGPSTIDKSVFEGASRIIAWHLNEARRFFGQLAIPKKMMQAGRLDKWLIEYCRKERVSTFSRREVQRLGPNCLRDKSALDSALQELSDAGRIREVKDGRRINIRVNPALLQGGGV